MRERWIHLLWGAALWGTLLLSGCSAPQGETTPQAQQPALSGQSQQEGTEYQPVSVKPNSQKKTGQPTTLTPVELTQREQAIARMSGEFFVLLEDPSGRASLGLQLYRDGELEQDFGYHRGEWSRERSTQLMLAGDLQEGVDYRWKMLQLSGTEIYEQDLSNTYQEEARSMVSKAVLCDQPVNVRPGIESVVGYLAFDEGQAGEDWGSRPLIKLGEDSNLKGIQQELAQYRYCYVITATIQ